MECINLAPTIAQLFGWPAYIAFGVLFFVGFITFIVVIRRI